MNRIPPYRGREVDNTTNFPIKPHHLPLLKKQAFDGTAETARSARTIISFCQKHGDWLPFTLADLQTERIQRESFLFNRLDLPGGKIINGQIKPWGGGWVVNGGSFYRVTEEFILRSYLNRPINLSELTDRQEAVRILEQFRQAHS